MLARRQAQSVVREVPRCSGSLPIAARYANAGIPVFFVRIPTRPVHRQPRRSPGSLRGDRADATGARLVPAAPYLALERPELFADEDHLNREGSLLFQPHARRATSHRALAAPMSSAADTQSQRPPRSDAPRDALSPSPPSSPPHRASIRSFVVRRGSRHRHSAALSIVRVLAFLCDRRRVLLRAAATLRALRAAACELLFLRALERVVRALPVDPHGERLSRSASTGAVREARRAVRGCCSRLGVAANLAFLGTLQVHELRQRTPLRHYVGHARKSLAAQSLRSDRHQLPHVPEHLVPRRRLSRQDARRCASRSTTRSFLAFFPQLLAGPIVRAGLFFGELFAWRPPSAETSPTVSRERVSAW